MGGRAEFAAETSAAIKIHRICRKSAKADHGSSDCELDIDP